MPEPKLPTTEPFALTRTNRRWFVGVCLVPGCTSGPDGGPFSSPAIRFRVDAAIRMRDHCRIEHDIQPHTLKKYLDAAQRQQQREEPSMKKPGKELPPLERLGEYEDHLCVFAAVKVGEVKSQFGTSIADCLVWVYTKDRWKSLGETPIFWSAVGNELLNSIGPDGEDPGESMGAYLRKGSNPQRTGDFFWLDAPSTSADTKLLGTWDKEFSDSF